MAKAVGSIPTGSIERNDMITYRQGDVLNSGEKYIVHGCNCKNNMGSGIAKQVREQYPEAWKVDQETLWGDKNKLGGYTAATNADGVTTINAYTQYDYSRTRPCVDYDAVWQAFELICEDFPDVEVLAMPKIGAGLGGGDWNIIAKILETVSNKFGKEFRIYEFTEST